MDGRQGAPRRRGADAVNEGGDYVARFDAAVPKFFGREAEYEIQRDGEPLTLSLPKSESDDFDAEDTADPESLDAARSLLAQLDALDRQAKDWLIATPGWQYGDDVHLWLLLVQPDNIRFCYNQWSVNDEQVIGFTRDADDWALQGPDPRFRGEGDNPWR